MSRWKKRMLGAVLLVCVAGAGVAMQFQNEIKAVLYHIQYSEDEQATLASENDAKMEQLMQDLHLPAESAAQEAKTDAQDEKEKPVSVDASQPKVPEQVTEKPQVSEKPKEEVKEEPKEEPKQEPEEEQNYDPELAAMVGEIYALRTSFVGQLDDLLSEAKKEYAALPEEKREKQKSVLLNKYVKRAGALESNCDSRMEEILGRISAHIKADGGDPAIVNEIREVYENEKALKKAYYLSLLD